MKDDVNRRTFLGVPGGRSHFEENNYVSIFLLCFRFFKNSGKQHDWKKIIIIKVTKNISRDKLKKKKDLEKELKTTKKI